MFTNYNNSDYFMITIILNKKQACWFLFLIEYDFEIRYRFEKFNFANNLFRRLNYKNKENDKLCLFILQNKLKNIIISILRLTLMLTRRHSEITFKTRFLFFKQEKVAKLFSSSEKKLDLKTCAVNQHLRQNIVEKVCTQKNSFKLFLKKILFKLKKL